MPRLLVFGHDPESGAIAEALAGSEFDSEVVTVASREAALTTLDRQRIDCVITGYDVPDERGRTYMGGLRLLEAVREEHGDLPVVIFTDVVNEDSLRLAAANGVRAYVRDQPGEDAVGQLRYHVDSAIRGQLAERRAAEQDRINHLMRGVTQTLVLEEDRGEMLAALCSELTEQAVYRYAAYHERRETGVDPEPDSAAGSASGETSDTGLARRCVERGTVETARLRRLVGDDSETDAGATDPAAKACETLLRVAVPIGYEDERFGVLVLETDPEHAVYESETAVLAELGEAIGHALNAVETRDALEQRETELERRTEQLERFASLVSHDVRNPLNVAQGYVDLLEERSDDPAIEEIAQSLDRIEAIISDILALTRAEQELTLAPTELTVVVSDAWAAVDTPNATLEIAKGASEDGGLPRVEADASQLQRVFENLFRNAIEHGRPDEGEDAEAVTLTVHVTFDAEDGELVVADDGVGFPDGATAALFELGETGSRDGTGIGLAIVGDLLERHGWTVTAENGPSGGACFRIGGIKPLE
ncbi:histidine kinase [Salinarchaeum sp. Harcht-Bsk1]|nr:histidine kinase [Salinarchaeum sp. Harcht-Bsk1]